MDDPVAAAVSRSRQGNVMDEGLGLAEQMESRILLSSVARTGSTLRVYADAGVDNDITVGLDDKKVNGIGNDADEDGSDLIFGGRGNDSISGEGSKDVIFGQDGNDTINGGTDRDEIYGMAGDDVISGGGGGDTLYGGAGDDALSNVGG